MLDCGFWWFATTSRNSPKKAGFPDRYLLECTARGSVSLGSDFGQVLHMDAVDGMRVFIRALLGFGIKPAEPPFSANRRVINKL